MPSDDDDPSTPARPKPTPAAAATPKTPSSGMTMIRPTTTNQRNFWYITADKFNAGGRDYQRRYHYGGVIMETDQGMVSEIQLYNPLDMHTHAYQTVKPKCSECKSKGYKCRTLKPEHRPTGPDGKPMAPTCAYCRVKNRACDLRSRAQVHAAGDSDGDGDGDGDDEDDWVPRHEHEQLKSKVDNLEERLQALEHVGKSGQPRQEGGA